MILKENRSFALRFVVMTMLFAVTNSIGMKQESTTDVRADAVLPESHEQPSPVEKPFSDSKISWLTLLVMKFGCASLIHSEMNPAFPSIDGLIQSEEGYKQLVQCSRCLANSDECP